MATPLTTCPSCSSGTGTGWKNSSLMPTTSPWMSCRTRSRNSGHRHCSAGPLPTPSWHAWSRSLRPIRIWPNTSQMLLVKNPNGLFKGNFQYQWEIIDLSGYLNLFCIIFCPYCTLGNNWNRYWNQNTETEKEYSFLLCYVKSNYKHFCFWYCYVIFEEKKFCYQFWYVTFYRFWNFFFIDKVIFDF